MAFARFERAITDAEGNIIAGASCTVRREEIGAPLADLYSDRDGATPVSNPATTDADGVLGFHCAGGALRIDITAPGLSKTFRYIAIGLSAEADGAGDVAGPAGATSGNIVVFSDGTGKAISDSGTTIADLTASILSTIRNSVDAAFDTLAEIATALGNKLNTSDLLSTLLGVDGSGSGLDADTVDGQHASDFEPADSDILKADVSDNLTKGYTGTSNDLGTVTGSTTTLDPTNGNLVRYVNGGAHTLAPPSSGESTMVVQITNNGSAGTITTSGFTKVTGSSFTTTNGDDFLCFVTRLNGFTHLHVQALQ